jgi:hypothetical protein
VLLQPVRATQAPGGVGQAVYVRLWDVDQARLRSLVTWAKPLRPPWGVGEAVYVPWGVGQAVTPKKERA